MTVVMKIDLVGPRRRGLALCLNEATGYGGVALAAGLSGWLAAKFAALEQAHHHPRGGGTPPRLSRAFAAASYRIPALRSCSQAGLVNNLNDGLAWGLVPLFLAAHGADVAEVGLVAAVWAVAQIGTSAWSDSVGRTPLIVAGMLVQAAALALLASSDGALGTALVYPTLDRGDVRRRLSDRAGSGRGGVSLLAGHGLCARRPDRRGRLGRPRLRRRDLRCRRPDRHLRTLGARSEEQGEDGDNRIGGEAQRLRILPRARLPCAFLQEFCSNGCSVVRLPFCPSNSASE
jgi:hypothetical protein